MDPDPANELYAGLERDTESGLDHAMFRQYSSTFGRWTTPDPYGGSYNVYNPQSLNRYAYVNGTPLGAGDPSGLYPFSRLFLLITPQRRGVRFVPFYYPWRYWRVCRTHWAVRRCRRDNRRYRPIAWMVELRADIPRKCRRFAIGQTRRAKRPERWVCRLRLHSGAGVISRCRAAWLGRC